MATKVQKAHKVHVKINDLVYVLNGKDAGKTGKVLKVDRKNNRVIVEGVNKVTRHKKPDPRGQTGGIVHQEAAIDASNVMLVCPKTNRPTKVGHRVLENGERVRYSKASGEVIDIIKEGKK